MPSFTQRLIRSGFGTRLVVRFFRKRIQAALLQQKLRHTAPSVFPFAHVQELNLFMDGRAYLNDAEIPMLARYARGALECVVEIGSAFGASSAILLMGARKDAQVHSIDPFVVDSMAPFQATKERCRANVERILGAARRSNDLAKWHLHSDYSYNLVGAWKTPIDFLFIDGDHTYEAVRNDFEQWLPHIKNGGFILFHDSRREPGAPDTVFKRGWPGPTQLAKELRDRTDITLVEEVFSITAWKKH